MWIRWVVSVALLAATILFSASAAPEGTAGSSTEVTYHGVVLVKSFQVIDLNGDHDGYPDSNETFDLWIALANKSPASLTNVVAQVTTSDPRIDCIEVSSVSFGTVPAGADVAAPSAFRLHVHPAAERGGASVVCTNPGPGGQCSNFVPVAGGCSSDADCRRTTAQDYGVELNVAISVDEVVLPMRPQVIPLDLDLNASVPPDPTATWSEGFEAGMTTFVFQNLDENKATNALSDGYRCQYSDPDFVDSNSYGDTECYLGFAAGQDPVNDWHVHNTTHPDGGRAFLGIRSLHYGKHYAGYPSVDTYPLNQMDAIRTKSTVNLAARVCRDDPASNPTACNTAADCVAVGGGPCLAANPELSIKHQVSLNEFRFSSGMCPDRAIVEAQALNSTTWRKLSPFENVYDVQGTEFYSNCMFDPVDDGNDEDSLFDPADPRNRPFRRLGPSSTCYPEFVFAFLGDTDAPFNAANIGHASDGPGLQGSLGPGTWVESKFDLSAFRGRSIRVRFLFTSLGIPDCPDWVTCFSPTYAWDDGWYIDDMRVTQTAGVAPTVSLDLADNSALPGNADGDLRGDACDCAPADSGAFAIPGETGRIEFAADKATLSWVSIAESAGSATVYDVVRGLGGELPVGSGGSEGCLVTGSGLPTASDAALPSEGEFFWYLVRARNVCGSGGYGVRSDGAPRISAACP